MTNKIKMISISLLAATCMLIEPFNVFAVSAVPLNEITAQESSQENSEIQEQYSESSELELAVFAAGDGDGSQTNPYIIDLTDTANLPSESSVSLAGDGVNQVVTLTGAGKYYKISGATESAPTANSIIIGAGDITLSLDSIYIETDDKTRAPLNTQDYNVTLDALSGSKNSFVNHYLDFANSSDYSAGILHTPKIQATVANGTLSIKGEGEIVAKGRHQGAGIGGGYGGDGGTISISGNVTVTAEGDANGAGIGAGTDGVGGYVKISDNVTVIAKGGSGSAGIGGSFNGGGKVEISGGTVTATGGGMGAGIGGGRCISCTDAGEITITGGVVTAKGGESLNGSRDVSGGAGLGSGGVYQDGGAEKNLSAGKITITGGTVFAYGAGNAPGIGLPYGADMTTSNAGTGIISSGNIYSVAGAASGSASDADIAAVAMPMTNGQATSLRVYQNLLAIYGKTTSEPINSFTASDASWYGITNSNSFVLADAGGNQAYISVWLPEAQVKETVSATVGGEKYRGIYDRKTAENIQETLYPQIYLTFGTSAYGAGKVASVNGVSLAAGDPVPDLYANDVVEVTAVPNSGYSFDKWSANGYTLPSGDETKTTITIVMPVNSVVLNPSFKVASYQITYDLDGGTNATSNPATYEYGAGVGSFAPASKTEYNFLGWFSDAARTVAVTDISATQTGDITLYAKFEGKKHTITYDLDGGTNATSNPATYEYGVGVTSFFPASKTGYSFLGWFSDAARTVAVTDIPVTQTGDVTLYAKFEGVKCTITYDLDGGTNATSNPANYEYGVGVASFASASKTGYSFEGWFSDAARTVAVTNISTTLTGNVTLYASWKAAASSSSSSSSTSNSSGSTSNSTAPSNNPNGSNEAASSSSSKPSRNSRSGGAVVTSSSTTKEPTTSSSSASSSSTETTDPSSTTGVSSADISSGSKGDTPSAEVNKEWSLLSLILTIVGAILSIVALIFLFLHGRKKVISIFMALAGIVGVILAFILNPITDKMIWFNMYSIIFIVIVVLQVVLLLFSKRKDDDDEEEEESDEESTNEVYRRNDS